MLKRLARKAGLTVNVHAHVFRHSYGTQAIANGGDLSWLKETMGHASYATTLKYVHQQPQDLMRKHAKFSPVNSLVR
jgi:site-specific recombinase XerD